MSLSDRLRRCLCVLALMGLTGCRLPAPVLHLPERRVAVNQAAAADLYARWAKPLASSQSATRLVATEEEITSLAAAYAAGTPLETLRVWVDPSGLIVSAEIRLGRLYAVSGKLQIESRQGAPYCLIPIVTVEGRPIPRLVRLSIQQATNDALADANLPIIVDKVLLGEGYLQVTVRPK